jgi:ferredoxin
MTYIVAEPCVNCRYTDCALVCPVEAFHLDDDMLVINPETCIDCDACVPECPRAHCLLSGPATLR